MWNSLLRKLLTTHAHELVAEISPSGYYSVECTFPGCGFNRGGAIDMKLVEQAKIVRLDSYYKCPHICWLGTNGPLQCAAYGSYCQIELRHILPTWPTPCLRHGHISLGYSDAEYCPFFQAKELTRVYGSLEMKPPVIFEDFPTPDSELLKTFLQWAENQRHGWPPEPLKEVR